MKKKIITILMRQRHLICLISQYWNMSIVTFKKKKKKKKVDEFINKNNMNYSINRESP